MLSPFAVTLRVCLPAFFAVFSETSQNAVMSFPSSVTFITVCVCSEPLYVRLSPSVTTAPVIGFFVISKSAEPLYRLSSVSHTTVTLYVPAAVGTSSLSAYEVLPMPLYVTFTSFVPLGAVYFGAPVPP